MTDHVYGRPFGLTVNQDGTYSVSWGTVTFAVDALCTVTFAYCAQGSEKGYLYGILLMKFGVTCYFQTDLSRPVVPAWRFVLGHLPMDLGDSFWSYLNEPIVVLGLAASMIGLTNMVVLWDTAVGSASAFPLVLAALYSLLYHLKVARQVMLRILAELEYVRMLKEKDDFIAILQEQPGSPEASEDEQ